MKLIIILLKNVIRAAPWCGRTEPLEPSPLPPPCCYPQHPRNMGSQNFSTCEMDRSWRHLHRSWLAGRQQLQIFRGAWQNTPSPPTHPPTRYNWKCARAYLYSLRHRAQSLEHVFLYQRHRYRSLCLFVCLSVSLLPVMQPTVFHSSITVRYRLAAGTFEQAAELLEHLNSKIKRASALTLKLYLFAHSLS